MMRIEARRWLLTLAISAWMIGCGDGETTVGVGGSETGQADTGSDTSGEPDTAPATDTGQPGRTLTAISVDPPLVELTSAAGSRPVADFDVVATYEDGTTSPYFEPVTFSVADEILGRIDERNGEFTASGVAGGETEVTVTAVNRPGVAPATATLRVTVTYEIVDPDVPADYEPRLAAPTTDDALAPGVVYPLDGAVMPQNVYPADVQWTRGEAGDLFEVSISKPGATVTAYLAHDGADFGNHWLVDEDAWRALAQTAPGEPAQVRVVRWVAAQGVAVRDATDRRLTFAAGSLTGSVYFWDISAARIKRIDDGTGQSVSFMPDPPNSSGGGQNCVGCHAVSNSGRYMVGRLGPGDNIGTVFDLTRDLSTSPAPSEFALRDDGTRWWFSTWSPDDTRLMITQGGGSNQRLSLMDPLTGELVAPQAGSLPQSGVTQPAWAPDNSLIAYVNNGDRWGGELGTGDIATLPVTGPDSFGTPQTILSAAGVSSSIPNADTACYPTWTPDSAWIAFAHGTGSRSDRDESALYLMRRDGQGVVELVNANGGPNTTDNFQPNFSPFEAGGYYWLSFLSKRPYGNAEVGTRGRNNQQLWVAAIEKNASPGTDPSAVAYWLPGQSVESSNIAGFWAPRACREDGSSCSVGSECCGGECVPDADGALTCSPPPEERCRERNETCSSDSDCCEESARCLSNVCIPFGD